MSRVLHGGGTSTRCDVLEIDHVPTASTAPTRRRSSTPTPATSSRRRLPAARHRPAHLTASGRRRRRLGRSITSWWSAEHADALALFDHARHRRRHPHGRPLRELDDVSAAVSGSYCWTRTRGLPSGSGDGGDGRARPGTSKGSVSAAAAQLDDLGQRRPQVARPGRRATRALRSLAWMWPAGPGLGPAEAGLDLHDRPVADGPTRTARRVEGPLRVGIAGLDRPVDDGAGPVGAVAVAGSATR